MLHITEHGIICAGVTTIEFPENTLTTIAPPKNMPAMPRDYGENSIPPIYTSASTATVELWLALQVYTGPYTYLYDRV